LHRLTTWALDADIRFQDLKVGTATLEDVYLELVAEAESKREDERAEASGV
jgi:hypothetical protein